MHFLLVLILLTVWSFIPSSVLSDGQHGLESPAIKVSHFAGHSHGIERRTILKNHRTMLKQRRSNSPEKNFEFKVNKTEDVEPNKEEIDAENPNTETFEKEEPQKEETTFADPRKCPPKKRSDTTKDGSEEDKTVLESPWDPSCSLTGNTIPKGSTPLPPKWKNVPPGTKIPAVAPPPQDHHSKNSTNLFKPGQKKLNGMPSTGFMKPMRYGWDNSGKFFASIWDNKLGGTYTALSDTIGAYSISWNGVDDILIGKGWIKGSTDRVVNYFSTFSVNGNGAFLSLYGWSTNRCREYYITESWGVYKPCNGPPAINKGTFESDGDTYTACIVPRTSKCIDGSDGFVQFWSVRNTKRTSGRITFANHVKAWQSFGMQLGTLNFPQIMAVEAYARSSGSAIVAIQEGWV